MRSLGMVAVADPDSGPADPPVPGRDQLHATSWQQRLSQQRCVRGTDAVQQESTATHTDRGGRAGTQEDSDLRGWTRVDVLPPDGMQEVRSSNLLSSTVFRVCIRLQVTIYSHLTSARYVPRCDDFKGCPLALPAKWVARPPGRSPTRWGCPEPRTGWSCRAAVIRAIRAGVVGSTGRHGAEP